MTETKGSSFWATLPGLVTAIAGMITAIAILVTTLSTLPAFQPQASGLPSGPPSGVESAQPVVSTASSATPSPSIESGGPSPVDATTNPSSPAVAGAVLFYSVRLDPELGVDNADLYSVDPETGIERRLTLEARPDSYPAWSPDRNRIAFDSRRGDGNRNIWVLEPDATYTALTNDARDDGYPTWSPDGTQLAWAAGSGGQREIWVMSALDGSGARRLTSGADDLLPSWSATGLIAFERRAGSNSEIWVVDPAGGGAAARITLADGGGGDPAWSPDGRRLAFTRTVDGVDRIYTVDPDGQTGLAPLTPAAGCDCDEPAWSPDGSQIAYVGPGLDGSVVRPIFMISASGGSARRLTTNGLGPAWGS
jgi:TolB protein